jgi:hypothetical protein
MSQSIDVTGLPQPVVQDLQQLVATLRAKLGEPARESVPPNKLSAEEWIKQFKTWAESHPHREIEIDDSRETIYGEDGE